MSKKSTGGSAKGSGSQTHHCIDTPMQSGFASPLKKGNTSAGTKKGKGY